MFVDVSFTVWMMYHVRVIHNGDVVLEFIQDVFGEWVLLHYSINSIVCIIRKIYSLYDY